MVDWQREHKPSRWHNEEKGRHCREKEGGCAVVINPIEWAGRHSVVHCCCLPVCLPQPVPLGYQARSRVSIISSAASFNIILAVECCFTQIAKLKEKKLKSQKNRGLQRTVREDDRRASGLTVCPVKTTVRLCR